MKNYRFKVNVELIMQSDGTCTEDAWDKVLEELLRLDAKILKVDKQKVSEEVATENKNSFLMNRFLRVL